MLQKIKNFDANLLDIDELVELSGYGRGLKAEYESQQLEIPDWLGVNLKTLNREIQSRNADRLEKLLREKKLRLTQLATPQEKREQLEREIAELEKIVK